MITWGLSGKPENRTATIFCMKCRESLASGLSIGEARHAKLGFEIMHRCKTKDYQAP